MFKGQAFRLNQVDKNRFEFRSAYTHRFGTISEIQKIVKDHADDTHRQATELAIIRQKLRQAGDAPIEAPPVPVTVVPTARPKAPPAETPPPVATKPKRTSKEEPKEEAKAKVIELQDAKTKRRPSGVQWLRQLMAGGDGLKKAR